jgi:hypothetical protein
MFAVAVAILALIFSAGVASAGAEGATSPYASQAKQAGLTASQTSALQNEVDRYLAQMGGKQVAANVIDLGGKHLMFVAVPGEAHPRDMTKGALDNVCDDVIPYGYFCAYSGTGFTGTSIPMYSCARTGSRGRLTGRGSTTKPGAPLPTSWTTVASRAGTTTVPTATTATRPGTGSTG